MTLIEWAIKHRISQNAFEELREVMGISPVIPGFAPISSSKSEAYVQSVVRREAGFKGLKLWRNNVGVLEDSRGVPVRYGLANDSKELNAAIKSSDLIGWRSVFITPEMVGSRFAQFVSRECKRPDWTYSGTTHELAQMRWLSAVTADGGDASFCVGEGSL